MDLNELIETQHNEDQFVLDACMWNGADLHMLVRAQPWMKRVCHDNTTGVMELVMRDVSASRLTVGRNVGHDGAELWVSDNDRVLSVVGPQATLFTRSELPSPELFFLKFVGLAHDLVDASANPTDFLCGFTDPDYWLEGRWPGAALVQGPLPLVRAAARLLAELGGQGEIRTQLREPVNARVLRLGECWVICRAIEVLSHRRVGTDEGETTACA